MDLRSCAITRASVGNRFEVRYDITQKSLIQLQALWHSKTKSRGRWFRTVAWVWESWITSEYCFLIGGSALSAMFKESTVTLSISLPDGANRRLREISVEPSLPAGWMTYELRIVFTIRNMCNGPPTAEPGTLANTTLAPNDIQKASRSCESP